MRTKWISVFLLAGLFLFFSNSFASTVVSIKGSNFYINGTITNPGTPQQGLIPNSRMIQGIFDDSNPATVSKWVYPDTHKWDPDRNTQEFINAIPTWRKYGLLAVTVGLQGGGPVAGQFGADQTWTITAFNSDGSLKSAYLARLDKIIRALDANGMVIIVNCFYGGQENRLSSDTAVSTGVNNVVDWLVSQGYTNVMLEIANEPSNGHYPSHPALQVSNIYKLVAQARTRAAGHILVGNDDNGNVPYQALIDVSDFILIHGNGFAASEVTSKTNSIRALTTKPIVFNEDSTNVANFQAATKAGASWGYYDQGKNDYVNGFQSPPINWSVNTSAKKAFFSAIGTTVSMGTLQISNSANSDTQCSSIIDTVYFDGSSSGNNFTVSQGLTQSLTTGTHTLGLKSTTTSVSVSGGVCTGNLSAASVSISANQTTTATVTYRYQPVTETGSITVNADAASDARCVSATDTLLLDGSTTGTQFIVSSGLSKTIVIGQHSLALTSTTTPISAGGGQSGNCVGNLNTSTVTVTAGQASPVTVKYVFQPLTTTGTIAVSASATSDSKCASASDKLYLDGSTTGTGFAVSTGISSLVNAGQHTLTLASANPIPAGGGQSGTCTSTLSSSQVNVTTGQASNVTATYKYQASTGGTCTLVSPAVISIQTWDLKVDEFQLGVKLTGFPVDSVGNVTLNGTMVMKNKFKQNFWSDQGLTYNISDATGTFTGSIHPSSGSIGIMFNGYLTDGTPTAMKVGDNPLQSLTINGVTCQ